MGLTSGNVLWAAVALAVLLFLATLVWWPRLARRGWRAYVGRAGLLLVTQVTLFAAVGLAANRSFLFYGSWADLFGQEQEMGVVVDHGAGSRDVRVVGTRQLDVPGGGRPEVGGQIQKVVVAGERSGIVSPAYVYLPPEYFQPRYARRVFPASVVLTGYPGTAENLIEGLKYPKTAYLLAKEGRMQPMILVMLRPTVAPPRDTECVDVPGGPRTETFFARDLPAAVSGTYRVGTKPRNWGFMGNSTGGYCALKIALHHPDRFAAAAGFSAYYRAAEDVTTGDLFRGDEGLRRRSDLLWSLGHLTQGKSSFLVTTSKQGEDNLRGTREFVARVKSPATVSSITLESGGHNFNTWNREIPPGMVWLSGKLSAA
ncbi:MULTISPECIES: alpha/beta hydrolase [unclassified Streptomyces]|uniref:alpha/beta hydrolase n=1 Tax=unclassified Streptomyces TaxID=2593676 RepID=UPI001661140E|nr:MULTISPECIES: alpha/beta hydrolase-fold protein [unclassified Streptomyces]MBD0707633.1 esterase [Streptomyces sp. CBMA291]MBD0713412.1 esterase [Streptomyces sp. CBMA370]